MCNCGFLWSLGAESLSWVFHFFKKGIRDSWQCAISCVHIHQACWRLENSSKMAGGVQHVHSRPLPTHRQWSVVYNIYRHKHNRSSWSSPQAVPPPTEPHTVKSIRKREANTVIFMYVLGVLQSHQELRFWLWSIHFEKQSGTTWEAAGSSDISHNSWGHHSTSLCPPSDVTCCLPHSAHLYQPQNNSGFDACSGGPVVNSSNWPECSGNSVTLFELVSIVTSAMTQIPDLWRQSLNPSNSQSITDGRKWLAFTKVHPHAYSQSVLVVLYNFTPGWIHLLQEPAGDIFKAQLDGSKRS